MDDTETLIAIKGLMVELLEWANQQGIALNSPKLNLDDFTVSRLITVAENELREGEN
jgi:hypothetical protein